MERSKEILNSLELVKQASGISTIAKLPFKTRLSNFFSPVTNKLSTGKQYMGKQWDKVPGMARYGIGVAGTAAFPAISYFGGKSEAEDHVANKAYEDAYNLTQGRIGKEWATLPAWQRYAASTLGIQNSMALKNWMGTKSNQPLEYSSVDATGNKTYY